MQADILLMQYDVLNVFIWDQNTCHSFQLSVYTGNVFATSKWNEHIMVQKNDSYEILSIFSVAIYHMHAGMNLFMIVHEKQITENLAHLLVNKNEIYKTKNGFHW